MPRAAGLIKVNYLSIFCMFNPTFLIAMPQLADPNFARSVVLMLHHDANGAFGLVLNNPSKVNLGTFARAQGMDCHPSIENTPVLAGGPVDTIHGWLIHKNENV